MLKIRPEIKDPVYWIHLALISAIVLTLLQLIYKGDMISIKNILIGAGLIGIGDIIAHTLLRLD